MFIGGVREIAALTNLYHSDSFEFVVLYGRRRVGKWHLSITLSTVKTPYNSLVSRATPNKIWRISAKASSNTSAASRQIHPLPPSRRHWRQCSSCLRRSALSWPLSLCSARLQEPCFHAATTDRQVQRSLQADADADALRIIHVLHGGSCAGVQGTALRQENGTDQAATL